ncbi:hypothetical protein PROFUN_03638 [Planoprotostelium fungivorum]|uniref:Uncharacterized protein n=1 Tax=Planoprotostelium fungivorum TaxID=1890364 RepID=A0A2P6NSI8_9EUKA|nr:hypothetical protein PROFUN_03638 [Planoprotostelium fungivorum]
MPQNYRLVRAGRECTRSVALKNGFLRLDPCAHPRCQCADRTYIGDEHTNSLDKHEISSGRPINRIPSRLRESKIIFVPVVLCIQDLCQQYRTSKASLKNLLHVHVHDQENQLKQSHRTVFMQAFVQQ